MDMPDRLLRRAEASRFLTERGYMTATATLAKLAVIGGGPPFQKFSRFPLYKSADLLNWATTRTTATCRSTSDAAPIATLAPGNCERHTDT